MVSLQSVYIKEGGLSGFVLIGIQSEKKSLRNSSQNKYSYINFGYCLFIKRKESKVGVYVPKIQCISFYIQNCFARIVDHLSELNCSHGHYVYIKVNSKGTLSWNLTVLLYSSTLFVCGRAFLHVY